jgi:hypothetical protein
VLCIANADDAVCPPDSVAWLHERYTAAGRTATLATLPGVHMASVSRAHDSYRATLAAFLDGAERDAVQRKLAVWGEH